MIKHPPRRILTPGALNKRKEREGLDAVKPSTSTKLAKPTLPRADTPKPWSPKPTEPAQSNRLLAGYLAHEFLTKGTLFGQPWDPAREEAVPVSAAPAEPRRNGARGKAEQQPKPQECSRYAEVADLLKGGGAHLPGIVNPSQLARYLQLR
ncbi:hypothetical protein RJ639_038980 [Escallonia herrerae]|uniref:Uncharacterized protein n=1 Tax=Escallonia herrerae TaxID=1293975 RepID=A0AA88WJT1_9ASTE|nr:hypothetical protein RJ639_038980 [Escallonia herrerae]